MSTTCYQLPDLLSMCPKKSGKIISQHFAEADARYVEWVKNCKVFGPYARAAFCDAEMPLLASLAWPHASAEDLCFILDYMSLSFVLEEMTDTESSEVAQKASRIWMQVLEDPADGKNFPHPMMDLIVELSTRLKDAVLPFHRPQFIDTNADFAKNVIQEAIDRENAADVDHTRSVDEYMITRRHTIGVKPCLVLLRSTRHLYIPDNILKHPILEEIENAALDTIYIANDIYSYKKETGDNGALNNILTVIMKDPETNRLDLQGSIDHAGQLFQSAVGRFHKYRSMLPSFGEEMDRQVQDYVDGLMVWSIGNIEWSMVNHRYNTFDDEESRQNGVMRMIV